MRTDFTVPLTIDIVGLLGITGVRFVRSSGLHATGRKSKRRIDILYEFGANHYLCGPSARAYIDEQEFENAVVAIEWMNYKYPEYPQLHGPFDPNVSILDLLFMTGKEAISSCRPGLPYTDLK
jgi:WbqC-like protein family